MSTPSPAHLPEPLYGKVRPPRWLLPAIGAVILGGSVSMSYTFGGAQAVRTIEEEHRERTEVLHEVNCRMLQQLTAAHGITPSPCPPPLQP